MSRRVALLALCLAGSGAFGEYYQGYEGNVLPELVPGWKRYHDDENGGQGGALRYIETDPNGNSYLVIDSRHDQMVYDYAVCARQMDPQPGEIWFAEWRMAIRTHFGYINESADFISDDLNWLQLSYTGGSIVSVGENFWSYPISPVDFHTYRIQSSDMQSYTLWIDGEHVHDGSFQSGIVSPAGASFGDPIQGGNAGTVAAWDYFRFGAYSVPEPCAIFLALLLCVLARPRISG
jgi:hypothetical protein